MSQITEEALTKSVIALDASRRVGWAKSFEAEKKQDKAERELNIALSDLAMVGKFAAVMFGFLCEAVPNAASLVAQDSTAMCSVLPDKMLKRGKSLGQTWLQNNEPLSGAELLYWQQREKIRRMRTSQRSYQNGKENQVKAFLKEFGFPDEDALMAYLALYKGNEVTKA